eukprot:gb/GEZN01003038.1/.p1 GENE.gb/GEZN01003038.1/~~gb/GEZN01003038.1/.p1  ORF type:complete len:618 (+),score=102.51 gb/GEZN01003038.1/:121-1974(+)
MDSQKYLKSPVVNNTRPRAELVGDVTLPIGHKCKAGEKLHKVWKVRNPAKHAWPEGTVLVFVEGEVKAAKDTEIKVTLAKYDEVVEVAVDVLAPTTAGYKTGTFRLRDNKQRLFGPWLELELRVYALHDEMHGDENEEVEEEEEYEEGEIEREPYPGEETGEAKSSDKSQPSKEKDHECIHERDIEWGAKIGQGSFGKVYKGRLWGQEVALKVMRTDRMTKGDIEDFEAESDLLKRLRHPNIVQFLGSCRTDGSLCIITEYLSGGSLEDLLEKNLDARKKMSLRQIITFALQICKGLNWLHHRGIIHRDLKTANVIMDANNICKIADFGLAHAKKSDPSKTGFYGMAGTPCYMAPEVLKKQKYGVKADVFSLGIILSELLIGDYPFDSYEKSQRSGEQESTLDSFDRAIIDGLRPIIPDKCPPKFRKLIQDCWRGDPETRPTVEEVTPRLQEIMRELDESEEDILSSLSEKATALFEEKRRRIVELNSQLKEKQNQANRFERLYKEEQRNGMKLKAAYAKLKEKTKKRTASISPTKEPASSDQISGVPRGPLAQLNSTFAKLRLQPEVLITDDAVARRTRRQKEKRTTADVDSPLDSGSSQRGPVRMHIPVTNGKLR